MKCPKCGTEMDDRANFCPVCGESLKSGASGGSRQNFEPGRYADPPLNQYRAPIGRRNIAVCIILSIVTCGIYGLYWLYCIVEDLNAAGRQTNDTGGGLVVLLSIVTCDIYLLYWMYKAGGKVNQLHYISGQREDGSLGILYLILTFFGVGIVSYALIQNELNKVAGLE